MNCKIFSFEQYCDRRDWQWYQLIKDNDQKANKRPNESRAASYWAIKFTTTSQTLPTKLIFTDTSFLNF
jgi:hypothetical protein